jgi:NAD(P)H-dependent flavin oxidoreductase YrpB (nitropropane dioxygenase family)
MPTIFKSQHPILEAAMNKGSTLTLALAVHRAGGYPSLCSWSYVDYNIPGDPRSGRKFHMDAMQRDIDEFVAQTGSNRLHISFDLEELPDVESCHRMVDSHNIPTVELIYGIGNSSRPARFYRSAEELERMVVALNQPLRQRGVKIFKRIFEPIDQATMGRHFLDGFCIKGSESGGLRADVTVKELFLKQQAMTPTALLIPYGGVSRPEQVKEYYDLGAEIVAVGTVLALSAESDLKPQTKQAAVDATSQDLGEFTHTFEMPDATTKVRKQTALMFKTYTGPDDAGHSMSLKVGMWDATTDQGHVYFGPAIDNVTEILPCKTIIENLVSHL